MSENSFLRQFSAQVSQSVFLAYLTLLRLITIVWPEMSENSSPPYLRFQCTSITNRFFGLFDRFTTFSTVWPEMWENSYLQHFSAQVSQSVFLAYLTVLRVSTPVKPKMSENSYFRHFSAQVSQSVFLAYLTVLRLITTVWPEISENSYLRHFSAQISQIVFFSYFTLITTLWP